MCFIKIINTKTSLILIFLYQQHNKRKTFLKELYHESFGKVPLEISNLSFFVIFVLTEFLCFLSSFRKKKERLSLYKCYMYLKLYF